MTPPPIRHPETKLHRSLHPIVLPRLGLGSPVKTSFHPATLHPPSFTLRLAALNLLPSSLSAFAAPLHEPVSTVSSPVRFSPFFFPWRDSRAPINPCGFSLQIDIFLGYIVLQNYTRPVWVYASNIFHNRLAHHSYGLHYLSCTCHHGPFVGW